MGTPLHQYSPLSRRVSLTQLSPTSTRRRSQSQSRHVRGVGGSDKVMHVRDLPLRCIASANRFRFFNSPFFSIIDGVNFRNEMSQEAKNRGNQSGPIGSMTIAKTEAEKKVEKPATTIPPPPEKPLPGDCCGSGCVRCVWDVYYEELEEYNKRYKSNSDSKSDS